MAASRSASEMTPADAADYVADFAGELATVARQSGLPVLAYLLDVACMEAKLKMQELAEGETKAEQLAPALDMQS